MSSSNPIDSSQQMESQPIPMDPEEVPEAKPVRKVPSYKLFAELNGHRKPISVVRFSPNGQLLASGSVDKYFRIWRTEGEIEEKAVVKAHVAGLNDIGWTYDSCFLATCSDDQTAKIFDVSTHKRKLTLKGHKDYIISVAFNAYGNMVLTGSYDNTARLWDVRDGRCIRELQGHKEPLSAASFNHDGTLICTSSHDGFVNLWDTTSGKCAKTVLGNHDDTAGISCGFSKFSPNGRYIMASKQDSNIYLIDIKKDKIVKRYTGHKNEQFCLFADFSVTSGSYIVCGSEDGKIYIWDLQQGEIVQVVDNPSPLVIGSVNCHPSKNVIVSSAIGVEDQVVRIWHSEA
ncbi:hypothetical protein L596_009709 [Steinernema carpocapsae]|uniref:WDR5-like beta-propeller domain-containing protein n=1 Tax=Steinernema carpocapsae TaxID=34508 RepID=A0A4U5PGC7_STECR|nr:hypothetical protein L596_009709 [Steinernema carpocapsae]